MIQDSQDTYCWVGEINRLSDDCLYNLGREYKLKTTDKTTERRSL